MEQGTHTLVLYAIACSHARGKTGQSPSISTHIPLVGKTRHNINFSVAIPPCYSTRLQSVPDFEESIRSLSGTHSSPSRIRMSGRSFLALTLTPEAPLTDWLAALDHQIQRAAGFLRANLSFSTLA